MGNVSLRTEKGCWIGDESSFLFRFTRHRYVPETRPRIVFLGWSSVGKRGQFFRRPFRRSVASRWHSQGHRASHRIFSGTLFSRSVSLRRFSSKGRFGSRLRPVTRVRIRHVRRIPFRRRFRRRLVRIVIAGQRSRGFSLRLLWQLSVFNHCFHDADLPTNQSPFFVAFGSLKLQPIVIANYFFQIESFQIRWLALTFPSKNWDQ